MASEFRILDEAVRIQTSLHYLEEHSHIWSCLKSEQSASYVLLRISASIRELFCFLCNLPKVTSKETAISAMQSPSAPYSEPLSRYLDLTISQSVLHPFGRQKP